MLCRVSREVSDILSRLPHAIVTGARTKLSSFELDLQNILTTGMCLVQQSDVLSSTSNRLSGPPLKSAQSFSLNNFRLLRYDVFTTPTSDLVVPRKLSPGAKHSAIQTHLQITVELMERRGQRASARAASYLHDISIPEQHSSFGRLQRKLANWHIQHGSHSYGSSTPPGSERTPDGDSYNHRKETVQIPNGTADQMPGCFSIRLVGLIRVVR